MLLDVAGLGQPLHLDLRDEFAAKGAGDGILLVGDGEEIPAEARYEGPRLMQSFPPLSCRTLLSLCR